MRTSQPSRDGGLLAAGAYSSRDALGFVVAQTAGALVAAGVFTSALGGWASGVKDARTLPQPRLDLAAAAGIEAALTFGLLMTVFLMVSSPRTAKWTPAAVTGALAGLIWAGAPHTGASMNPARSFGPDVVASSFGALWCYIVGPVLGAAVAAGVVTLVTRRPTLTAKLFHDPDYPSVHATWLPARPHRGTGPHPAKETPAPGAPAQGLATPTTSSHRT